MIRLLFIVPYPELRDKVEFVLANHPEHPHINAEIQVMTVEDTPDIPAQEYDAIIARGYTAQKTGVMYTRIPTIGMNISGYDLVRAITECCDAYHPKKIAICGFSGHLYEAQSICRFFGTSAEVYAPVSHNELPATLERALAAGCDALIGGYSANILAKKHGLNSVIIRTGEDTIAQAIDDALRTVDQIRQERILAQMYKTIIYASKDGILYVNGDGIIKVRNQTAKKMSGGIRLLNQPLKEALPYLHKTYREVVADGQEETGKIIPVPGTKTTVSVDFTPVIVEKQISGVVITLTDITQIQQLESQIRRKLSERGLQAKYTFQDIIHESGIIASTIETAGRYAVSESNIIIVGETGTGKELFAQSIHNISTRRNGPFVAINCAALPENLLESELFGYVEGAFTGTSKGGKMGLFEQAHGGTLFLDEIGEISLSTQIKLLRVLQERQVRRIGDNKVIDINVRIISATNKSMQKLVEQGLFRKDLMYRLDVLRLFLPPLREREHDIELLFLQLLKEQSRQNESTVPSVMPDALPLLYQYPFSGNIRELKNMVERASVFSQSGTITRAVLEQALYPPDLEDIPSPPAARARSISGFTSEPDASCEALAQCQGNQTRAAGLLGIDRSTLWRKMQKYQIKSRLP